MIRKPTKIKIKPCGFCKKEFVPQRPLQVTCSVSCSIKFNDEKEAKKRVKQMKSNITKLSVYEDIAKKVFQKWIRMRDQHLPCISCGTTKAMVWHGSHYFDAGMYSGVIFHPMNCHKSCDQCNLHKHGNKTGYRMGLAKRYGEGEVIKLEILAVETRQYKYSREELQWIALVYKQKLKDSDFAPADLNQKNNVGKPIDVSIKVND